MSAASSTLSPKVAEYADRNLSYVADAKLNKLAEPDLRELWRRVAAKTDAPCEESALLVCQKQELVEGILAMKKHLTPGKPTGAPPDPPAPLPAPLPVLLPDLSALALEPVASGDRIEAPPRPVTPSPPVERIVETALASSPSSSPVQPFVEMHSLSICSWNSLELRFGDLLSKEIDTSEEADVKRQYWLELVRKLSEYDVIVMQEVPASEFTKEKRTRKICEWLHQYSEPDVTWTMYFSDPSGKDGKTTGARVHVHACWVRNPVEVTAQTTLTEVGGQQLDYAPLQLALHDPRFADPADRQFVLTSVHLPPDDRKAARDVQLKKLLSHYGAADTTRYRLGRPFGPNKIAAAPPMHIICGDFNIYPGALVTERAAKAREGKESEEGEAPPKPGEELYGLSKHGFVAKLPEAAATSEGRNHYDNFLVDATSDKRFLLTESILPLNRTDTRLSDHDPVILTIEEVRATKQASESREAAQRRLTPAQEPRPTPKPNPKSKPKPKPKPAPAPACKASAQSAR